MPKNKFQNIQGLDGRLLKIQEDLLKLREGIQWQENDYRAVQASTQAKNNHLGYISHEIRTLLNSVIGFSDLLKHTELNVEQEEWVDGINEGGQMLLSTINDVLDLSKIDLGKIQLEKIDFNLEYLVESLLKLLRPKINQREVSVVFEMDSEMPRVFKGDPSRIRQIFLNLLNNALKFTEKGNVKIRINKVSPFPGEKKNQQNKIKISIKDDGIGIPRNQQKNIFKPFEQAEASTNRHYGGSGLGLSIVTKLVAMMEGTIHLISDKGKGSEFIIYLNLKPKKSPIKIKIKQIKLGNLKGKRIMVVEENETSRRNLSAFCRDAGMKISYQTDNTKKALDWLENLTKNPHFIISDGNILTGSAKYFAKKIKNEKKYLGIKIIHNTLEAFPGIAEVAKKTGYDAFLPKPILREELIKVILLTLGDKVKENPLITKHLAEEIFMETIKVLLVEDDPLSQKLMQKIISNQGFDIDVASNGQEALKAIEKNNYDICFMDVQMPILNGIEATKKIRKNGNKNLPIVALTATATLENKKICLSAGMDDYLTKPVNPPILKETILKWKKRKSPFFKGKSLTVSFMNHPLRQVTEQIPK